VTAALRIVVADDHPLVRSGLAAVFAADDSVEVVGQAATGAEAVEAVQLLQPDVVVMDLHMPGLNGIEATSRIRRSVPGTAVLILTMYEDDASLFAALRAGARGYLLKGAEQEEILSAMRAVAHGGVVFGTAVAQRVLEHFTTAGSGPTSFPELTEREREVLDLVAAGFDNATIARRLSLSVKTVSNHVSNVFAKLHVDGRSQAIVRAREAGLGRG
jgi:DNA-binding NarL/FixJ family response regulator